MTLVSFFRGLYSLDALDTRFTTSSKTPARAVNDDSAKSVTRDKRTTETALPAGAVPSRWRTPEFYFYSIFVAIMVLFMYKAVLDVSLTSSPHYAEYSHLLSPGWLFGRKVDNSDGQYSSFRDNIPYLAILVVVHPALRRVYNRFSSSPASSIHANGPAKTSPSPHQAQNTLNARLRFDLISALVLIAALHGFSALKIVTILYLNFSIGTTFPRHLIPAVTWVFNISILFANEFAQGYRFTAMSEHLAPFVPAAGDIGKYLDSYGGLIPRWEVFFKITVLRLISFNIDYYWSLTSERAGSLIEKKQLDPAALSERDRVSISAPSSAYTSFATYLAYTLYPPLYLAGPILSFNDYISQATYTSASITIRRTVLYGIRFLITLFCMEFVLHTVYAVAIIKADPDWSTYTPFQLSMLAYFNLHIIWLKLLIPWRFFRLWSLIDGIDPPENMIRCMSDNYSTLAFWRSWHRSYNRWIVRYIYIPLGGTGGKTSGFRKIANMLAVFMFIAIWHDINLQLLTWGWMVVFFVLPEILATSAFPSSKWKGRPELYRVICGIGAVFNILMMMAANLVGFAIGLDGLKGLVANIVGSWQGGVFLVAVCVTLFIGVQVMFEHREGEKRRGINMKC